MVISDPIGDLLTRIRNANLRRKDVVQVPASKMLTSIAEILMQEGFVASVKVLDTEPQKTLELEMKYVGGKSAIRDLQRISKPGVRYYTGYKNLKPVRNGLGIGILSTPKGVMTVAEAQKQGVGGEYLCQVW